MHKCRCDHCKVLTVAQYCGFCIIEGCDVEMRWKHHDEELEEMAERAGVETDEEN